MTSNRPSQIARWPLLAISSVALYFVFHLPLALLYSAVAEIWPPLALAIPFAVLYIVYRRPLLRIHFRKSFALGKLLYWGWTAAMAAGLVVGTWLVDRGVVAVALVAAPVAGFAFPRKRAKWVALGALVAAALAPVWWEPWLLASRERQLFALLLLGSMVVFFALDETRRISALEFGTMVLLVPLVCTMFAFYRAPEPPLAPVPGVTWLHSAADPASPGRVKAGDDLRFAARDCRGRLLLGGASRPGLEWLPPVSAVVDPAPTGDNLVPVCGAVNGVLYGSRDGRVVWRTEEGQSGDYYMGQPVLTVQFDPRRYLVFGMNRLTRLVTLRWPELQPLAERTGGISIDILISPAQGVLYRSVFLRGVEMLEPASLNVMGTYPMRSSVGGTMDLDEPHRRLFLSDWLGNQLHVLDARDLTPVSTLATDRGIRRVVFDSRRQLLLAGSYFRGDVLVYRPYVGGVPQRVHVGRRVRGLTLDGDRCLGVSASGVFALNLNAFAGGGQP